MKNIKKLLTVTAIIMFNFSSLEAMNSENEQISNKEANQRMADYSMNGMKDRFVLYNSECSSDMDVKIIKNDSQSDKCALDVEEISSMEVVIPSFLFNDEAYSKMFGLTSTKIDQLCETAYNATKQFKHQPIATAHP